MPNVSTKITAGEVKTILEQTDWTHYRNSINWVMRRPECHFYDGDFAQRNKIICPIWQHWLAEGRTLYHSGEEGLAEYLQSLKHDVPSGFLKMDHIRAEEFLRTGK